MKLATFIALCLSFLATDAFASVLPAPNPASRYMGVKVVRIPTGPSVEALDKLNALVTKLNLERWTTVPTVNSHLDVEVPSASFDTFMNAAQQVLNEAGILEPIGTMHEDLGSSILEESKVPDEFYKTAKQAGGFATPAWFNAYHPYDDHLTFISDLAAAYPNNAKVVTAGKSVEGRAITGINIFGSSGSGSKPAIIWHSNVHAREWITSMVTEYIAHELLSNYGNSTEVKSYVDKYDFYIFPVVNPDGFVYSQTTDRMWRKNRQTPPSGSTCYGRDINRNWDVHWSDPDGASTNPCAEDYKGQAAFDAPETKTLAAFTNSFVNTTAGVKMYMDWHSYSQMFFTPYGFSCELTPPDDEELTGLAEGFTKELKSVYGTEYSYGSSCKTIYKTTGASDDWAYDVSKIKYSFSTELRDTGSNGFVLPANQIRPSGIENWEGIKYLLKNMQ
ncbi:putative carboxypeptidase [Serendipita vermifera]|nr:putative carboxypeptidase [Serendipita vermifera]